MYIFQWQTLSWFENTMLTERISYTTRYTTIRPLGLQNISILVVLDAWKVWDNLKCLVNRARETVGFLVLNWCFMSWTKIDFRRTSKIRSTITIFKARNGQFLVIYGTFFAFGSPFTMKGPVNLTCSVYWVNNWSDHLGNVTYALSHQINVSVVLFSLRMDNVKTYKNSFFMLEQVKM